jgi:hypothetical protein
MTDSFVRYPGISPSVPAVSSYSAKVLAAAESLQLVWPEDGADPDTVCARILDVSAGYGAELLLPTAKGQSVGYDLIINNIGSNTVSIQDFDQAEISSLTSGKVLYLYLIDNSTEAGTWKQVQYGSTVSTADAGALAGRGLLAYSGQLNSAYNTTEVYSDTYVQESDRAKMFAWKSGTGTFVLQTLVDYYEGFWFALSNQGTGTVTVTASGSETVDGVSSIDVLAQESLIIVRGPAGWYSVGRGRSQDFSFSQVTITLAGTDYTLTTSEAANVIQKYVGTLTASVNVVIPAVVQTYYINNATSGAYSVTVTTSTPGAAEFLMPQGNTAIVVCDGSNVYNAHDIATGGGGGTSVIVPFPVGSAGSPSITCDVDQDTGFYFPSNNEVGLALGGTGLYRWTPTGMTFLNDSVKAGTRTSLDVPNTSSMIDQVLVSGA